MKYNLKKLSRRLSSNTKNISKFILFILLSKNCEFILYITIKNSFDKN